MEDRQVSLKQVLDTVDEMPVMKDNNGMEFIEKSLAKTRIGLLQPELNEWCTDCKEYDQERHCCPRFNKVIRETVEEYKAAQPSFSQPHENDHSADGNKMVAQTERDVLAWLLAYHTKSFELHGRYLPHEVISWLVNDFSKEFIAERREE